MAIEVEARFSADDRRPLDELRAAIRLGPATLGPPRTFEETDRYLDTDAGDLAGARWACRLRTRDGVTKVSLKGPPEPGERRAWHHRRPEIEGPAVADPDPAAWPQSAARDRLAALSGGRSLRERLRLEQERTERRVDVDGDPIGTLSCDVVVVRHGDRAIGTLHLVELELHEDDSHHAALDDLAASLAGRPDLRPEPRTKLERALELLAAT